MGATTTTTLTELCPAIVGEAMYWMSEKSLFYPTTGVARQFIQTKDITSGPGIAATFNRYAAITAGDATEGSDYTTTSALDTTDTVTVTATEKVVLIPVTDLSQKANTFGANAVIADAGRAIGIAMAEKFDKDVMDLFDNLGTSKNATNSPLIVDEVQQTITALAANKAPMPYAAFIHPWGWYEFLKESSSPLLVASSSLNVAGDIWKQWFLGNFLGIDWFQHASMPKCNADADWNGAIMSPWAIGAVIAEPLRVEMQRDATARYTEVVGVMGYGVGVLSTSYGYAMSTDVD